MTTFRFVQILVLGAAVAAFSGCELAGFVAQSIAPKPAPLRVMAEYRGLEGRSVAVLVDANQALQFSQPLAQREVCEWVSRDLAANVSDIRVVDAQQIVVFQSKNLYWNTATYDELARRLDVERLVLIELTDYRVHEPGNVNIWRGVISGNVAVAEADGDNPNNLVYDSSVTVTYPPDKPVGALEADQKTIRFGALDLFTRAAAGKFYDHKEARK